MKFSIRDLFWLVLVAGIGCTWWLDRERLNIAAQQDRDTIARLKTFGVNVDTLLRNLMNPPPTPTVIKLTPQFSRTTGFDSNSDFQAPPQRPETRIEQP